MSGIETSDFQSEKTGSTPVGSANKIKDLAQSDAKLDDTLHVELHVDGNHSDVEPFSISARLDSCANSHAQIKNSSDGTKGSGDVITREKNTEFRHPAYHMHPGPMIRERMRKIGLSLRDLCKRTGLSVTIMSRTLSGEIAVSPRSAVRIARLMDMDPIEILTMQAKYNVAVEMMREEGLLPPDGRTTKR